jgi:hypothetical protein
VALSVSLSDSQIRSFGGLDFFLPFKKKKSRPNANSGCEVVWEAAGEILPWGKELTVA